MSVIVRPLLLPKVNSLMEVPMALLHVALFAVLVGPLLGRFIGWLFLPAVRPTPGLPLTVVDWIRFAAPGGMAYGLVFYSVFGLALRWIRIRYRPSGKILWLLAFAGWIQALLLLTAIL